MSIQINQSSQFDKFVEFAEAAKRRDFGTAIAEVGAGGKSGLGNHAIKLQKNDSVAAGFTRSSAARESNDLARSHFHGAIVDMFGGEAKIPESVRKAMLLGDYGKGKPLTARRILAVKAAIDGVKAQNEQAAAAELGRLPAALAEAKNNAARAYAKTGPGRAMTAGQLDAVIEGLLRATLHDKEAFGLVVKNIAAYLIDGADHLRGAEEPLRMAGELLANLDELRALAKTYRMPGLVKAGADFIQDLGGKPVETGAFTAIVRAAAATKVDAMKGIGASSRTAAIHRAALQLSRGIEHICTAARTDGYIDGADALASLEDFIIALQLLRCGAKAQRSIQAALRSEAAQKVATIYGEVANGQITVQGHSADLRQATSGEASRLREILGSLKRDVDRACGVEPGDLEPLEDYDGDIDRGHPTVARIGGDLAADAAERMRRDRAKFLSAQVKGGGAAADALRGIYDRMLGPESATPHGRIYRRKEEFTAAILNRNLLSEMRRIAAGEEPRLRRSLADGLSVSLPGGAKLSADFETARDQLAAFVTKGAKAGYAALSGAEKAKVHVAMALLGEQTEKAILDGMALSLDPDGRRPAFAIEMAPGDRREFSLSFNDDGDLRVQYEGHKDLKSIRFPQDATPNRALGDGSSCEVSLRFDVRRGELERLAGLDLAAFDDGAIRADAERPVPQKNILDHVAGLPGRFRFQIHGTDIGLTFKTTLVDPPKKKAPPPESVFKTVPRAVAEEAVRHAAAYVAEQHELHKDDLQTVRALRLSPQKHARAAELVARHGRGLTAKGLRMLAAAALNALGMDDLEGNADAIVKRIAKDIAAWRDFEAGDPRFAAVDARLLDYAQGLLDDYLAPGKAGSFDDDGVFDQLVKDANRSTYVIGGQTFNLPRTADPKPVVDAFKAAVKPEHRKAISALMNQMIDNLTEMPSQNMPFQPTGRHPQGMDLSAEPGLGMLIRRSADDDGFYSAGAPADPCLEGVYALEIAPDGRSAKLTVTSKGLVRFRVFDAREGGNNVIGTFTRTQEIDLDLSGPDVRIADLHLSQAFDA